MKLLVIMMFGLFLVAGCAAQKGLPAELPEDISVRLNQSGAMSRSYKKIRIENGILEFEQTKNNRQELEKWSAKISRADLAKLYKTFVENKFETIKNDERKGIVYDAGSETISISIARTRSFNVTYGKNSPLSGKNLERYQAIRKAIDELVAKNQNGIQTGGANENYIQGVWRVSGQNAGRGWFLEWTFDNGNFKQIGYPPIAQTGKYRVLSTAENCITLELYEQKGTFGETPRELQILIDKAAKQLKIDKMNGFARTAEKKND